MGGGGCNRRGMVEIKEGRGEGRSKQRREEGWEVEIERGGKGKSK